MRADEKFIRGMAKLQLAIRGERAQAKQALLLENLGDEAIVSRLVDEVYDS